MATLRREIEGTGGLISVSALRALWIRAPSFSWRVEVERRASAPTRFGRYFLSEVCDSINVITLLISSRFKMVMAQPWHNNHSN